MTYRGEIEGRLDPYFYQPEFTKLEAHVRRLTSQKLRDFIVRIAGGSTPDIKRHDEYYTDAHNGVSFIRVQNLSPEGLQLDDCKYVTFNTHNGLLKRSQVSGGDLLVKITGVGRMAVSSVVHYGFEGNINQHIAAIKTQNYQTSEVLATFLNSDIGEKLASRRSTGGTRPALDYSALKSIPIIYNPQIVEIMQSAYAEKKQKEQEANALLDSIDDYVLAELGIEMPAVEEKKCFVVYANERAGRRIDSYYHLPYFKKLYSVINDYEQVFSLRNLVSELDYGLMPTQDYADSGDTGVPMIRVTNLLQDGSIDMSEVKYIPFDTPRLDLKRVKADDILMVQCGNTTGKTAFVPKSFENYTFGSFLFVIRGKKEIINQRYLLAILSNRLIQEQIRHTWNIVTVRPNTSKPNVQNLLIPVPAPEIQDRIADEVMIRKSKATKLRQEADAIVAEAKREVERVMLGGVSG